MRLLLAILFIAASALVATFLGCDDSDRRTPVEDRTSDVPPGPCGAQYAAAVVVRDEATAVRHALEASLGDLDAEDFEALYAALDSCASGGAALGPVLRKAGVSPADYCREHAEEITRFRSLEARFAALSARLGQPECRRGAE